MTPSWGLFNLLEQLRELRKSICSLHYRFMAVDLKGCQSRARGGDTEGKNKAALPSQSLGPLHHGEMQSPRPNLKPTSSASLTSAREMRTILKFENEPSTKLSLKESVVRNSLFH